jgi:hypothetical protein
VGDFQSPGTFFPVVVMLTRRYLAKSGMPKRWIVLVVALGSLAGVAEAGGLLSADGDSAAPVPTAAHVEGEPGLLRAPGPPAASPRCDHRATVGTLGDVVSSADRGTVCLAAGDYGTVSVAAKSRRVRLIAERGAAVRMALKLDQARNVTFDGLTVTSAVLSGSTRDVTVRNSTFRGPVTISGLERARVLFENNAHVGIDAVEGGAPARIHMSYSSNEPSGVTVRHSLFAEGDADGIQTGVGMEILDNEFRDIRESGPNHTDAIQLLGARGTLIRGNFIHNTATGIVAYDGVERVTIERNVINNTGRQDRPWGIELYGDDGSRVRHNTLAHGECAYELPCGLIELNRKPDGPAGKGTVLTDNVATAISLENGSRAAEQARNLLRRRGSRSDTRGTPKLAGGEAPKRYSGYRLARPSAGRSSSRVPGI